MGRVSAKRGVGGWGGHALPALPGMKVTASANSFFRYIFSTPPFLPLWLTASAELGREPCKQAVLTKKTGGCLQAGHGLVIFTVPGLGIAGLLSATCLPTASRKVSILHRSRTVFESLISSPPPRLPNGRICNFLCPAGEGGRSAYVEKRNDAAQAEDSL